MDPVQGLNQAMQYIEAHLRDEVDAEALSRMALCSAGSFTRMFSLLTGSTLREYVRKRRLTRAAYALRDTDAKVIDIALDYGYESADSFARAFTRQHGASPSQVRRGAPIRATFPISFHITIKGAEDMEFRMEEKQAMVLRGVWTEMACAAGGRFAREHELWASECENLPGRVSDRGTAGTWYGVWQNGRYAVARAAEEAVYKNTEDVCIFAGTYAVFTSEKGGFAGEVLPRMREQIREKALKDAGFQPASEVEIEVYHLFPRQEKQERYYEIWIPI